MSNVLEQKLSNFTSAIKKAIKEENWYSALSVSLMLPDICGKLEFPQLGVGDRYRKWFDKYLYDTYNSFSNFLTAEDFYLLRCAYLHGGEADISEKKRRQLVDEYKFRAPKVVEGEFEGPHRIKMNQYLILRIDLFCLEICNAVDQWVDSNKVDERIQNSARKMLVINSDPVNYNGAYVE